jgi:hypothetical protein
MSWWYRSPVNIALSHLSALKRVHRALLALAAMTAAPAFGAEVYYQPVAVLTAENDSNLDLDPNGGRTVQGYLASVGTLVGIATPNADATIRPRLEYRDYPKDPSNNRLEEYLDLRADYRWTRSSASIAGIMDHRDDFNAEFASATFDTINPVQPTAPATGKVVVGLTRTNVLLVPQYNYKFTPTVGAGFSGVYQSLSYSRSDTVDHVDFNYYLGRAFVDYAVSARTDIAVGGFGSKYDAIHVVSRATGSGATVDVNTNWTQLLSSSLSLVYQHTSFDTAIPILSNSQSNAWGATFNAAYKAQASQYRVNFGRLITPSGGGGLYVNDQVQFQYGRDVTERLAFTGAVIALRNHGLSPETATYSRNYVQTVVEAKYMIRPTWFVQGGYQYARQKYQTQLDGAMNNRVYISVGYQGLGRQY